MGGYLGGKKEGGRGEQRLKNTSITEEAAICGKILSDAAMSEWRDLKRRKRLSFKFKGGITDAEREEVDRGGKNLPNKKKNRSVLAGGKCLRNADVGGAVDEGLSKKG